jgi:hypothetical protein
MLQNAFETQGDRVLFANTQSSADARAVLREIISLLPLPVAHQAQS